MKLSRPLAISAIVALVAFGGEARAIEATPSLDGNSARDLVACTAKDAVDAFAGQKFTPAEAQEKLQGLLAKDLDMEFLSRQILGRFWRTASPERQREFSALLTRFIIVAYGGLIDEVPATLEIQVADVEPQGDRFIVHSLAGTSHQDMTPVDWTVARTADGRPAIADISVEGVGLIRAKQEEFGSILRAAGGQLDGLVAIMRGKINRLTGQGQEVAAR